MVSTSFVKQSQIQIRLPEADSPAIVEETPEQIDIMITEAGTYFVNGRELINTAPRRFATRCKRSPEATTSCH